jgi:hypothetical protein
MITSQYGNHVAVRSLRPDVTISGELLLAVKALQLVPRSGRHAVTPSAIVRPGLVRASRAILRRLPQPLSRPVRGRTLALKKVAAKN